MKKDILKRLREANINRSIEWSDGSDNLDQDDAEWVIQLLFRSNELGGEAGEAQNQVKKLVRKKLGMIGGKNTKKAIKDITDELADTIICVDRLASHLDIDLEKAIVEKFNEVSEKRGLKEKL